MPPREKQGAHTSLRRETICCESPRQKKPKYKLFSVSPASINLPPTLTNLSRPPLLLPAYPFKSPGEKTRKESDVSFQPRAFPPFLLPLSRVRSIEAPGNKCDLMAFDRAYMTSCGVCGRPLASSHPPPPKWPLLCSFKATFMPPRCHTANKALKSAFGLVIYEERRAGIPSSGGVNDAFSAHRPKNPSLTCCEIG